MSNQKNKENPGYYNSARPEILGLIPENSLNILEVGCGSGDLGKVCKEALGAKFVAGIEYNKEAALLAGKNLDQIIQGDVEELELPFAQGFFDCIVYADILEHLVDPAKVLKKQLLHLSPTGKVVASIPNVRYFAVLSHLVEGNWTYQDEGILDRDHLRFFTLKEMLKLFAEVGLKPSFIGENLNPQYYKNTPKEYPVNLTIGRLNLLDLNESEFKDLFVFQYLLVLERL
ncbi:MAG: class I SAM-dependent methyltransferase [Magnetococcales bacterium]|nr:class I SAM-dependent methyltransferase [Magnetococcales bacterium]